MTDSITIFANKYSQTVDFLQDACRELFCPTVVIGENSSIAAKQALENGILFFVGDTCEMKQLVAQIFDLTMFFDNFAQRNIADFCQKTSRLLPPSHIMDKLCALPDNFNNFLCTDDMQCGCYGQAGKKLIFVIPDDILEAKQLFDMYIFNTMTKLVEKQNSRIYKIFSLNKNDVVEKLATLENTKFVTQHFEAVGQCDFRLRAVFSKSAGKNFSAAYEAQLKKLFGGFLYASKDTTLEGEIVSILSQMKKSVAVAESLSGGIICSKLVDISGASKVLYEGVVTYSAQSKSNRLKINPLFIDKNGVVSAEVAREMAKSLLCDGHVDFSVSTTGYAGPNSEKGFPVGLCYVAVGTKQSIKVFRFEFCGSRHSIRHQVANSALFLLLSVLKGTNIAFDTKH